MVKSFLPATAQMSPRRPGATREGVLKVTLRDIKPPIWRRLDVPADISLAPFHRVLQAAMPWTNSHLHQFEQGRAVFGTSDREFGVFRVPETSTSIGELLIQPKDHLEYLYDFGDSWTHRVLLERVHDDGTDEMQAAFVMTGKRACPPEDCGGSCGYAALLEALADAVHDEHDRMAEWIGGAWDAEAFPIDAINRRLARIRLRATPVRRSSPLRFRR